MHDAEIQFTQKTLSSLGSQYPGKNLLIYHNTNSLGELCTSYLFLLRVICG
jgi:hypothetical protein